MHKRKQGARRATHAAAYAAVSEPATLRRRAFLRGALVGGVGVVIGAQLGGCANASSRMVAEPVYTLVPATVAQPVSTATASGSKVLLVYFSRPGENYSYGGRTTLAVGNTEVVAGMIRERIVCDVYRIEPAEPYADSYDATVARNVREQNANARPAIANPLASILPYDTVLLGSPIWNVRAPMIMSTFAESFDFTGKNVVPFVTYAVSGLGTAVRDYIASCPGATIGGA